MTLRRNLNQSFGGRHICGTPLVGVLGRFIPRSGGTYPSLLANDQTQPQDADTHFRLVLISHNFPAGTLSILEDGSLTLLALPDGSYSMLYRLEVDGTPSTIDVGYGPGRAVFNLRVGGTAQALPPYLPLADLDRWLPFVLPAAPGCPTDTARHHIRQAAIEFLERTHAWVQELPAVASVTGADEYALTLPAGAAAVKLFAFSAAGVDGRVIDAAAGRSKNAAWHRGEMAAWMVGRATVGITPAPTAAAIELVFVVSLKPTQAAIEVPEEVFEHYAEYIGGGALARVLKLPGQTWTDAREANALFIAFEAAIDRVQWQVQKNFGRTTQRTVSVWF